MNEKIKLNGWEPIDTAPHDVEVFIGRFNKDGFFEFGRSMHYYEECNIYLEPYYKPYWAWSIDDCPERIADEPQYWRPMFEFPEQLTPTEMPDWLEKQFDNAEATVQTWSHGKKEAAGL